MAASLSALINTLTGAPWLEIIRTIAPVLTAWIAFSALQNWKKQDRAKREAEFLDQIIDATHQYVLEMQRPIALVRLSRMGMAAHSPSYSTLAVTDNVRAGAIKYIEARGEQDGKRLREALKIAEPAVIKLRSLSTKGQVFKFIEYTACFNAVTLLTWHYDHITAFASMIESSQWNWQNSEVSSLLEKVIAIDTDETLKSLSEQNSEILKFSRRNYQHIYG